MTITVFLVVIIEKVLEYSWNVLLYSRTNVLLIEYVKIYKVCETLSNKKPLRLPLQYLTED